MRVRFHIQVHIFLYALIFAIGKKVYIRHKTYEILRYVIFLFEAHRETNSTHTDRQTEREREHSMRFLGMLSILILFTLIQNHNNYIRFENGQTTSQQEHASDSTIELITGHRQNGHHPSIKTGNGEISQLRDKYSSV